MLGRGRDRNDQSDRCESGISFVEVNEAYQQSSAYREACSEIKLGAGRDTGTKCVRISELHDQLVGELRDLREMLERRLEGGIPDKYVRAFDAPGPPTEEHTN